jgi:hypothetical protein
VNVCVFLSSSLHPLTDNNDFRKTMNSNVQPTHNLNPRSHGPNRAHRGNNHSASVYLPTNHKDMGGTQAYTISPATTHSQRPQPGTRSLSRVAPFQIHTLAWDVVPHMLLHSHRCNLNLSRYRLRRSRRNRPRNRSPSRHMCNHIQHRTTR